MKTAAWFGAAAAMLTSAWLRAESLTIDNITYEDFRWGHVTPADVSIIQSRGIHTVPLPVRPFPGCTRSDAAFPAAASRLGSPDTLFWPLSNQTNRR